MSPFLIKEIIQEAGAQPASLLHSSSKLVEQLGVLISWGQAFTSLWIIYAFTQLKLITTECISLCQAEAGAVHVCIPQAMKGESGFFPKCNQFNVWSRQMWENISYVSAAAL